MARQLPAMAGPDTALIIVECQQGVVGAQAVLPALAIEASPILPVIRRLAVAARRAGVWVAHANYAPAIAGRARQPAGPLSDVTRAPTSTWTIDGPAVRTAVEIGVEPEDLVFCRRHGLSPAHGTELLPVLRSLGVEVVVVTGVSLNVAVTSVVLDAVNEGFRAVVPTDAVAGTPPDYARAMLRHTVGMLATLTTADALTRWWAADATAAIG